MGDADIDRARLLATSDEETEGETETSTSSRAEIARQASIAAPVSVSMLSNRARDLMSIAFVGHASSRGAFDLAGAALACTLANVTGLSLIVGMASAVNTLAGQSFGRGEFAEVGATARRACAILFSVSAIISVIWVCETENILVALGQPRGIAHAAAVYVKGLTPGLFAYSANACVQAFLQSQAVTRPQAIGGVLATIFHAPMNWFLMYYCKLGVVGAALATSMSTTTVLTVNVAYITIWRKWCRERDETLAKKRDACAHVPRGWLRDVVDVDGAKEFLALGLPGIVLMSEWWASELLILFAGYLPQPDAAVAAMSIYQVTNAFAFMIAVGFGVAAVTRVSHELGKGNARQAKYSSTVALRLIVVVEIVVSALVFFSRKTWGCLFTKDTDVTDLLSKLMVPLAFYVAFDALCCVSTSILRGCGRQSVAAPIVVFAYYCVGIPSALLLAFKTSLGAMGLAIGGTIGTATHAFAMCAVAAKLDWNAEVARARVSRRPTSVADIEHDDDTLLPPHVGGDDASL